MSITTKRVQKLIGPVFPDVSDWRSMTKATKTIIPLLGCVALFFASCEIKNVIYDTPHPDKGIVTGVTEWYERSEGVAVPSGYRVEASGTTMTVDGTMFTLPVPFDPGAVEVLVYNVPAGVGISNGTATVNSTSDGTAGTLLVPDAGVLFSGTSTADVIADDTVRITVPMRQRMRQIRFMLTVTEGNPERITAIEARLEGVAASIDLRTGEVTGNAAVRIPFTRVGNKLTADVWVVGTVATAVQNIVTKLTFTDGNPIETTSDVTDAFRNFNADKLTPLDITGSLYALVGAEQGGTIIDWTQGGSDDVDANM